MPTWEIKTTLQLEVYIIAGKGWGAEKSKLHYSWRVLRLRNQNYIKTVECWSREIKTTLHLESAGAEKLKLHYSHCWMGREIKAKIVPLGDAWVNKLKLHCSWRWLISEIKTTSKIINTCIYDFWLHQTCRFLGWEILSASQLGIPGVTNFIPIGGCWEWNMKNNIKTREGHGDGLFRTKPVEELGNSINSCPLKAEWRLAENDDENTAQENWEKRKEYTA